MSDRDEKDAFHENLVQEIQGNVESILVLADSVTS